MCVRVCVNKYTHTHIKTEVEQKIRIKAVRNVDRTRRTISKIYKIQKNGTPVKKPVK